MRPVPSRSIFGSKVLVYPNVIQYGMYFVSRVFLKPTVFHVKICHCHTNCCSVFVDESEVKVSISAITGNSRTLDAHLFTDPFIREDVHLFLHLWLEGF